jgi:hypothetical protein
VALAVLLSARLLPAASLPVVNVHAALLPNAIIIDDGDANFQLFGPPTGWRTATSTPNDYYTGDVTWTTNISATEASENYARWTLPVSATLPMTYEVMAFVPRYNSTTQLARYVIHRNGITQTRTLNQNAYYAEWVSLGTYPFVTGTNYVELGDATGEAQYSKRIGFDAIAFVPQLPQSPITPSLPFTPVAALGLPLIIGGSRLETISATTSRYIQTIDPQRHYRMGCAAGQRGENGVAVLAFGQPWAVDLGYGALIFGALFPATLAQVSDAAKGFIRGYAECAPANSAIKLDLGLGVNNYKGETNNGHGRAWAGMVNGVDAWLQTSQHKDRVRVFGAADMEPSWNTVTNTRAWVDGYVAVAMRPLINFGSCDGCPTGLNPNQQPNNGWTVEDIWYISAGAKDTLALPEIYLRSGIHADQWYRISLHGATQHNKKIAYAGVLTQYAACQDTDPTNCALNGTDNTPTQGLQQLNNAINADARTAFSVTRASDITWKQDGTLIAAQATKFVVPAVAHRTLGSLGDGVVVTDVQPPLPAHVFIGNNMWLGEVDGAVTQVYAGTVRGWTGEGVVTEHGGVAAFDVLADGTIALRAIVRGPEGAAALSVVDMEGNRLTLVDAAGRTFGFDVITQQWSMS